MTSAEVYGPWRRLEEIGQGGNAVVWRAEGPDGTQVALKVINEVRPGQESYARFAREVEFLRSLGPQPGVLPLLDSYLPENPSKDDRAWLAMPIATPIDQALDASRSLQDVVAAVASIAETLARLEREHDMGHRDIKPGNLYELDGEWLIGDFGLISVPDVESITRDGRQVGPAHFTAYEMILRPSTADAHPADVYSLGKTLWVLASGQRYAPPGHQPAGGPGGVGDWRPHRRAAEIDREIDRMTQARPEDRPTKSQVAADLASWLEFSNEDPEFDISGTGARMRAKLAKTMGAQDAEEKFKALGVEAAKTLQELVAPIEEALAREFPRTQRNLSYDEHTKNLKIYLPRGKKIFDWRRTTLVSPLDGPFALQLRVARVLELFDDGTLYLLLELSVKPAKVWGMDYHWRPGSQQTAPVGTIEAQKMLEDAVREVASHVGPAVDALVERMPDEGPTA